MRTFTNGRSLLSCDCCGKRLPAVGEFVTDREVKPPRHFCGGGCIRDFAKKPNQKRGVISRMNILSQLYPGIDESPP